MEFHPSVGNLGQYDTDSDLIMYETVNGAFIGDSEAPVVAYADPYIDNLSAEFQESHTIHTDAIHQYGISTIAFDTHEELLWMGNQGGYVSSYYGAGMQKYTAFKVHESEEVRCIQPLDECILALTPTRLRSQLRRGVPLFTHESENMVEMQCMLPLQNDPDSILMGGHQSHLIQYNVARQQEINLIDAGTDTGCAMLRQGNARYVFCGDPSGVISLRDPLTLNVEHTLNSHTGSLSDFDVHGNLLVTCGFSQNRQGNITVDRLLMVYDIRMMRPVSPIDVMLEPFLLRFMPSMSPRVAVASNLGQLQFVDTVTLTEPNLSLYQISSTDMVLSLDVSSTAQAIAVGDSASTLHLFSPTQPATELLFNSYSRPTELADPVDMTGPPISITDEMAVYSAIALTFPLPDGVTLSSDWPRQFIKKVYRKTPPIDPEILNSMKMQGTIGYAPNPNTKRRNQVDYMIHFKNGANKNSQQSGGLSKDKLMTDDIHGNGILSNGSSSQTGGFVAIPKRYRKIEMKFTKLGAEDYELDQYNKTIFSGLEATLPNSYCNAMIQVLFFIEPLRKAVLSHLCTTEFCLCCELSFLFHMLSVAKSLPCHSGNFLRALRNAHEASALGLILPDQNTELRKKTNLISLIQNWNRFILHQVHCELLESKKRSNNKEVEKVSKPAPAAAADKTDFVFRDTDFPTIDLKSRLAKCREKPKVEESAEPDKSTAAATTSETSTDKPSSESPPTETISTTGLGTSTTGLATSTTGLATSTTSVSNEETEVSRLFGSKQLHINRCLRCKREMSKESSLLVCNLVYPEQAEEDSEITFCEMLAQSLCPEQTTPAWCEQCERFQPTLQSRRLKSLPQLLTVNCNLDNKQDKAFWQNQMDILVRKAMEKSPAEHVSTPTPPLHSNKPCRYGVNCTRPDCRFKHPGQPPPEAPPVRELTSSNHLYYTNSWLPQHITIELQDSGQVEICKLDKTSDIEEIAEQIKEENNPDKRLYDLSAVVCYVHEDKKNLVSIINVPASYHKNPSLPNSPQWYIFNDFCISQVTGQEAIWFSLDWKIPCVLYFTEHSLMQSSITTEFPPEPISWGVFSEDVSLAENNRGCRAITFTPLSADETPQPGEIVAMDAEFVTLNQEESEIRSGGKLSTVKPSHYSVARITCVRGQGPLEGTPFIDDYIATQEQVVDYLTKFSGIKPGDLDVSCSSKHLTTLKSTYLKLRFLIDNGVKFVGHGLSNDFRVINLMVPPEQIIDTVQLFYVPGQRMVSLRFLAWHYLGMKIQSQTHDSIEDAKSALELYKVYLKLQKEGSFKESLDELYEIGKSVQWKVPGVD
uniref:PAN2-PAN3 deadenylation complex catalytic subunit PAN2 n=1 Tax=Cacopsylla melanoneura TaxID=428564 RepID=A0A8D8V831_9HEMI